MPGSSQFSAEKRRLAFAREFIIDLNAKQAAIRVGYAERSAESAGSRLLRDPIVRDELLRLRERLLARAELTAERVLAELSAIAFSDIRDYVQWDEQGRVLRVTPPEELTARQAASIRKVKHTKRTRYFGRDGDREVTEELEVELFAKQPSIDTLAKYTGVIPLPHERVEPPTVEDMYADPRMSLRDPKFTRYIEAKVVDRGGGA